MNHVASPVTDVARFGAILALATSLFAGSASGTTTTRGVARFDGTWSVEVVTEHGLCDHAARYRAVIKGGEVRYADGNTFSITGRVEGSGTIKGRIVRGAAHADVIGRLVDHVGGGTWTASGLAACSGRWNAERRA